MGSLDAHSVSNEFIEKVNFMYHFTLAIYMDIPVSCISMS